MRERHASFLRFSKSATREEKADEGGMGGQERQEQIYKNVNQVRHDNGDALAWIIRGENDQEFKTSARALFSAVRNRLPIARYHRSWEPGA